MKGKLISISAELSNQMTALELALDLNDADRLCVHGAQQCLWSIHTLHLGLLTSRAKSLYEVKASSYYSLENMNFHLAFNFHLNL